MINSKRLLIIGNGRLAAHWLNYYQLINASEPGIRQQIEVSNWSRSNDSITTLPLLLKGADQVLLCISDSAIQEFYHKYRDITQATWFHFSGALRLDGVQRIHPLMTFGDQMHDLAFYQKILMVKEIEQTNLPLGFNNPTAVVSSESMAEYHFLLSLAGNWSQMLMAFSSAHLQKLGIKSSSLESYLITSTINALKNPPQITGPLIRQDHKTLAVHADIARQKNMSELYAAFTGWYEQHFIKDIS